MPLVKQDVTLRRLVTRQRRRHRGDQVADLDRGAPRGIAVVEHDRQHRRAAAVGLQRPVAAQLPVQQGRVFQDAQRHVRVVAGLELQQDQHVEPGVAVADAPDGVAVAGAPVVADVGGGELGEGGEVDGVEPVFAHEAPQQVLDHAGEGEQTLVVLVVHGPDCTLDRHLRTLVGLLAGQADDELKRAFSAWTKQALMSPQFRATETEPLAQLEEMRTMLAETVHEWTKDWVAQGREEGREQGREEGREQAERPRRRSTTAIRVMSVLRLADAAGSRAPDRRRAGGRLVRHVGGDVRRRPGLARHAHGETVRFVRPLHDPLQAGAWPPTSRPTGDRPQRRPRRTGGRYRF